MRITWVTRSFLDYRIPVYKALADKKGVNFYLICSNEQHITPQRCITKVKELLGNKVILLSGEKCFGKPYSPENRSNSHYRIFWQPDLLKQIKKTKPDIVITDAFNHWTLPVFILKFFGGNFKHILCYERTKHTERTAPLLKRKFISLVKKYIDAVHCNGILCKEFLSELGYPENKLMLGNMAADTVGLINKITKLSEKDKISLKKKYNIKKTMYLFVGQLIPRKGIKELLKAWQSTNLNHASLVLVGDGMQREELENIIAINKIKDVIFTGNIDYERIVHFYKAADCFIIPTLEDNWSLVVPEAMSCGLPIICSIYNGCYPELVRPENGWVFDPLNESSFINILKTSFENKDRFMKMGKSSLRIVKDFTPDNIADKIFNTCNKILKNS